MTNHIFTPSRHRSIRLLQGGITFVVLMALLFIPAGRLDWWMGWVFIGVAMGAVTIGVNHLEKVNADLVTERRSLKKSVQKWDFFLTNIFSLICIPLALIVAGLDQRFGWSNPFPLIVQILGLLIGICAAILVFWIMSTNQYFSTYVRIQAERGHTTVSSGAYRYLRHPGYLAMIIAITTIPLILGSCWTLIPAGAAVVLIIVRTALEDKTLQAELPGYQEYTQETRYRLLPGIW